MAETFEYLSRRVEAQREWHSQKAAWNKRWFYRMETTTLVAAAAIPFVNLLFAHRPASAGVLSAFLGGVVVVAAAIGKLYKFHENWLQYRSLVETLDREKEFYLNAAADYAEGNGARRNQLLVERVENILAATTSQFVAAHRAREGGEVAR